MLKKKLLAGIIIVFVLLITGRYGWKLNGFNACEGAGIESIQVNDGMVEITGYDPGLNPEGFIGYYSEEEDGKLYVGFKFDAFYGFFKTGDFKIQIPVKSEIKEIYMKTYDNEYLIWSKTSQDSEIAE